MMELLLFKKKKKEKKKEIDRYDCSKWSFITIIKYDGFYCTQLCIGLNLNWNGFIAQNCALVMI